MSTATELPAGELQAGVATGRMVLVDIREPIEYAQERIPGAHHVPAGDLGADRLRELGDGARIVLYCRTGRRSTEALRRFPDVSHLEGGIEAWKRAGLQTESSPGAPRFAIFQQVLMTAGSLVLVFSALGAFVHPAWHGLAAAVGAGQVFSGATNTCAMAALLSKMPWNRMTA